RLDFFSLRQLTFRQPDLAKFPCLALAYEALEKGGNAPCVLNAANEIAVGAVLNGELKFGLIPEVIRRTISEMPLAPIPDTDSIYAFDSEARLRASEVLKRLTT
ncbi:MAG: 1-deoxy-D-xylulose-5-phosphate reductoisomerase, partial [Bacteroidales bacterium]